MSNSKNIASSLNWNDEERNNLVLAMSNEVSSSDKFEGLNKANWSNITKDFNEKTNLNYTKTQLQSQATYLKKKYQTFKALKENSGFGWDDNRKVPTAPDNVWNSYIESHKNAKEFRYKSFPFYDDLDKIYTGSIATGKYAISSSLTNANIQSNHSHDQMVSLAVDHGHDSSSSDEVEAIDLSIRTILLINYISLILFYIYIATANYNTANNYENNTCSKKVIMSSSNSITKIPSKRPRSMRKNDISSFNDTLKSINKAQNEYNQIVKDNQNYSKNNNDVNLCIEAYNLFNSKFHDNYKPKERFKIKHYLSINPTQAHLFSTLDDDEMVEMIDDILNEI
mmetsp:Transcript_13574/g.12296  ORF Transcript_13574/g.12296 Transcript_13574/m.12296 type:complete len:339 (-) Transcript_13574:147-1163(-)